MDWQKACKALSRAADSYADRVTEADGDRAEAARLLWARSRHDTDLREALVKTACALLALSPRGIDAGPAWELKRRPGRLSMFDKDPEVATFVRERLGTMTLREISHATRKQFGDDRAPRPTAIHAYWQRLDKGRRT